MDSLTDFMFILGRGEPESASVLLTKLSLVHKFNDVRFVNLSDFV